MHIYSKRRIILLLIFPVFIIFLLYIVYPLLKTVYFSFMRIPSYATGVTGAQWYGLNNYIIIFRDRIFLRAILNSFTIMVVGLVITVPLGFLVGMLFMQKLPASGFVKACIFMPHIMSGILVGILWSFILDPGIGLLNGFLRTLGLDALALPWIGGQYLTPVMVGLIGRMDELRILRILFMSGMKMMPKDTLEAAAIDGANGWQRMTRVIIPMLKETFKTVIVLTIISSLNVFETVRMLTGGGPNNVSQTLATYIYEKQFAMMGGVLGQASAMCVVMAVLVLGFSIAFLNATKKRLED